MIHESENFRAFEHAGWETIANSYHEAFGGLTSQAITPLLDAAEVKSGTTSLDIACGPGYVAAAAADRGAAVVGVDFSAAMVAFARQRRTDIEFQQGDAEQLPLRAGLFDAAAMNFGILHLAQPQKALLEAFRVLRSGGRFAFSVWAPPEETIGFGIVLRAIELHGDPRVQLPDGPPFFRYSNPEESKRALIAAGFTSPTVSKISQLWRLPAGDGLFNAMKDSTVRTAGLLRAQKPAVLGKVREAMQVELEKYTEKEFVELPMPALIASGFKR